MNGLAGRAAALAALGALAAACTSAAARARERLARELGRDPVDALRAIGSAPSAEAADELARSLRLALTGQQQLDLLRFGLASDDERVVFGAVKLDCSELALPQLRHAAGVVLPRLGDADCPLHAEDVAPLLGSVDIATVAARVPSLPVGEAVWLLGAIHRMIRADSVPPMCELALATTGAVRRSAFANASMAVDYSGEHVALLLTTWLQCHGQQPDRDGDGLPGSLRAALRVDLDASPPEPAPPEGTLDSRPPALPAVACMRWLRASRPDAADLPLLRRLVAERHGELVHGAIGALANMDDDASMSVLRQLRPAGDELRRQDLQQAVLAARARRGDEAALEELFAAGDLEQALTAAPPARCSAFAMALLRAPAEVAEHQLDRLGEWSDPGNLWYGMPRYDGDRLADLEPFAAAMPDLPTATLCRLLVRVPGCRTQRLADALLARRPQDVVTSAGEHFGAGDLGDRGLWPFLEVTRPDALRRLLRDGLRSDEITVRDVCAPLLLRLGGEGRLRELIAWVEAHDDDVAANWLLLARERLPAVVDLVRAKVATARTPKDAAPLLPALAVGLGMPFEFAQSWHVAPQACDDVRSALLGGDAAAAFLRTQRDQEGLDVRCASLAAWPQPAVLQFLRARRAGTDAAPKTLVGHDLRWALHAGDETTLSAADRLVRDGRCAMHYGVPEEVRAHEGLRALPFWIDELASNCCRAAIVEEVLELLFATSSEAYGCSRTTEPAIARLRRRLLPVAHRLRWSRIANAFVVAGS